MICAVIGDSIAVGVGSHLPHCDVVAKVGITSHRWLEEFHHELITPRDLVIISLGSNDLRVHDSQDLQNIRGNLHAKRVIWLLPADNPLVAKNIRMIAEVWHDDYIDLARYPRAPDHVHPTGEAYKRIAEEIL